MNDFSDSTTTPWQQAEQWWTGFRLATLAPDQPAPYGLLEDHWMLTGQGKILAIEARCPRKEADLAARFTGEILRGNGRLLTPGLIDCHTHLVFGGNRVSEWERRLQGESYTSIAADGGGILSTVRATRAATEEELFEAAAERISSLISEGITTLEIKSGYGLDLETELKMLRVARRLAESFPVDIQTTLLAAHSLPPEYANRGEQYIDWVCRTMIPAATSLCTAVDVFCEKIAFSVEQSRRVLEAGRQAGLQLKIHAEQLSRMGGAVMAAELGALSIDHIEYLTPPDCEKIARLNGQRESSGQPPVTVATLLPGAFYYLKETQLPPIEALRDQQIPIAVATDFNPGSSPVLSLRTAGNLACQLFGLTPEESLRGVTLNAARALALETSRGSLEVGKRADFAVWKVDSPGEIFYTLGGNPCQAVYRGGLLR